jgi:CheY-like chemotaxis protein
LHAETRAAEGKATRHIVHQLGNLLAVTIGQTEYLLHEQDGGDADLRHLCLTSIRQAALDARTAIRRLDRALLEREQPGAPPETDAARVWQGLLQALSAMRPGESLCLRVVREDGAIVVSGPAAYLGTADADLAAAGERNTEGTVTLRLPGRRPVKGSQVGRERSAARVLIIDDEPEVRETLAALLAQAGCVVETAASGSDGIERYRRRRFDCVVTDMQMPGLSGMIVSRAIKDHDPSAFVVLVTGFGQACEVQELRAAGIDRIMMKPFDAEELLRLIDKDCRQGEPVGIPEARGGRDG